MEHTFIVFKTANRISYQKIHPDDTMKTERFDCVSIIIQELTEIMSPKTFISPPVNILFQYFQHRIIRLVFVL